jgi:hypothetical protein
VKTLRKKCDLLIPPQDIIVPEPVSNACFFGSYSCIMGVAPFKGEEMATASTLYDLPIIDTHMSTATSIWLMQLFGETRPNPLTSANEQEE